MNSKSLKMLLGTTLVLSLWGTTASGQDMEAFKVRMSQAAEMMKKDVNEALHMYLEIRTEYAGAEVDYSLGRAYQRLYQCDAAKHYYTEVMVKYNLDDSHPIYQRAVTAYDEISSCDSWQRLNLQCEIPAGGKIQIDEQQMSSCWSRGYMMKPGEHVLKLISADGKEIEEKFTAEENGAAVSKELKFPPQQVSVEHKVEVEHSYVLKEKFHPALYWGLIAGGAAFVAGSGFFSAMANNAYAQEQKYADLYAVLGNEDDKKKADDARGKVKMGNILTYTFAGVGGAAVVTGIALAIVNAVSDKEKVEENKVEAYVIPTTDGMSLGFGMHF